jgi:hypothetical protein
VDLSIVMLVVYQRVSWEVYHGPQLVMISLAHPSYRID